MITVPFPSACGCQWQWHRTWASSATRKRHSSGGGKVFFRRRKFPARVIRWRLRRYRRAVKESGADRVGFSTIFELVHAKSIIEGTAVILTEPENMPIFEYICQQCDHRFEAIVLGKQKASCPKCESKRLSQQLSSFSVGGEKADQPGVSCGTCGDPRGPGACAMN